MADFRFSYPTQHDPFPGEGNGVAMPGQPSNGGLSWAEVDVSQGLEADMSIIEIGVGPSMGGEIGAVVPLTQDTDAVFDGGDLFVDPNPTTNNESQFDSMSGLLNDSHIEILANDQMYGMSVEQPFAAIPETAEPLNEQ